MMDIYNLNCFFCGDKLHNHDGDYVYTCFFNDDKCPRKQVYIIFGNKGVNDSAYDICFGYCIDSMYEVAHFYKRKNITKQNYKEINKSNYTTIEITVIKTNNKIILNGDDCSFIDPFLPDNTLKEKIQALLLLR